MVVAGDRTNAASGDRIVASVIVALAALLPVMIVLAHRGVAPVVIAMGLVVAMRPAVWRAGVDGLLLAPVGARSDFVIAARFFFAFCLWALAAGLWSPHEGAWKVGLNALAPALASGAVIFEIARIAPREADRIAKAFAICMAVAIGGLIFEAATNGFLRTITPPVDVSPGRAKDIIALGRGATIIAITLAAALLLFNRYAGRRLLLIAIGAAFAIASFRFGIFSNVIAVFAGGLGFALCIRARGAAISFVAGLWIAFLLLAPLAALLPADAMISDLSGRAPASWLQRLAIWKTAGVAAVDCQPFGCGAEYARVLHQSAPMIEIAGAFGPVSSLPLHPHNLFLQIWLELGLPGVALLAAALWFGARAVSAAALAAPEKAAVAAVAAAMLVSALFEASLWQVWRNATLGLAAILVALSHQQRKSGATAQSA